MIKHIERKLGVLVSLIVIVLMFSFADKISILIQSGGIKLENLYTSFFDLFSLLAAFLFGFFAFIKTDNSDFLSKFKKTKSYSVFLNYLQGGIAASAIGVLVCIPLIVFEPKPSTPNEPWFYYICFWIVYTIFSIVCAVRATLLFVVLTNLESQN